MKKKIMKNIITLIFLILIFSDCDSSYSKVNFIESIKHHLSDTDLEHLTSITFKIRNGENYTTYEITKKEIIEDIFNSMEVYIDDNWCSEKLECHKFDYNCLISRKNILIIKGTNDISSKNEIIVKYTFCTKFKGNLDTFLNK